MSQQLVHHNFYCTNANNLAIHLRVLPGRVCEHERPHLQSSPRDQAWQVTIPHSYSHRHSHYHQCHSHRRHHLTQSVNARARALVPLQLRARLGSVGDADADAAGDEGDECLHRHQRSCVGGTPRGAAKGDPL